MTSSLAWGQDQLGLHLCHSSKLQDHGRLSYSISIVPAPPEDLLARRLVRRACEITKLLVHDDAYHRESKKTRVECMSSIPLRKKQLKKQEFLSLPSCHYTNLTIPYLFGSLLLLVRVSILRHIDCSPVWLQFKEARRIRASYIIPCQMQNVGSHMLIHIYTLS